MIRGYYASGQADYIGIIVTAAHFGPGDAVSRYRARATHFVRGDAHAVSGATYQYATIFFVFDHFFGERSGKIRKIILALSSAAPVVPSPWLPTVLKESGPAWP